MQALLSLSENMEFVGSFFNCNNVVENVAGLRPDVVLMDIEMPETNGIEGVILIKKHFPEVRIIMQTVFEDDEKIFASLQAGAEGYLLKSASAEKILQSIEEVYAGGASMTASIALRVIHFFNEPRTEIEECHLTKKEMEVLMLLSDGNSYKMIADKLNVSYFTVNSHIKKIYEKLHVHSLGEALKWAYKNKLL